MTIKVQIPSIVLPQVWSLGTETETIDDLVEHTSIDIPVEYLQEKIIHVTATEVAGITGTIVGVFTVGEPVVGVPSGATGVVIGVGATWIQVTVIAGTFAVGDTITGTIAGATINGGLTFTVPGPLWCWIELSPVASTVSTAYWAAIGGGGGALVPIAPHIEVSGLAGVPGTLIHGFTLPWSVHSVWARIVIQTPVAASVPVAYWGVQVLISAKSP